MTVAEAIERKISINYLKELLRNLQDQRGRVQYQIDDLNSGAQDRLDRLLEQTLGKDLKARPTEITEISEAFWKTNKAVLEDPIKIDEKIEELDRYIDRFENDVDLNLSIINATTFVEV